MPVYNLYIFDRYGTCLYYNEWHRNKHSDMSKDEEFKLMYGMLFSLNSFCRRMSPIDQQHGFLNYKTSRYKLSKYETASGLKFVMNTDPSVDNIRDVLHHIYSSIYVEYVVKNPLCTGAAAGTTSIQSELFEHQLDEYVRSLPFFASKVS